MENIQELINSLIDYALNENFIYKQDIIYVKNKISNLIKIEAESLNDFKTLKCENIGNLLEKISEQAFKKGLITSNKNPYNELFETKLMGELIPFPSTINKIFWEKYKVSAKEATDWYFKFSKSTNYIKTNRIAQNLSWDFKTDFATIVITINLSKPEKDPKAIAEALKINLSKYPECFLCKENVGFSGHVNHPPRQTHRVIDLKLADEDWFIQYSPYMYYNEHMIVINEKHTPMKIDEKTFVRLADFLDYFPHYFIGSNADIPIVGGSMLSHDHYQAGRHKMPIDEAKPLKELGSFLFKEVTATWLNWPLTTIRLRSKDRDKLIKASVKLNDFWQKYEDKDNNIIPFTGNIRHNTVTPIMRKQNDVYELDIVLRNNLTNKEFPGGIYHPHPEIHPVKKENIGLIEVMGYAILPARLKNTISDISRALENNLNFEEIKENNENFENIFCELQKEYSGTNAEDLVKKKISNIFATGLSHCGVMKIDKKGEKAMDTFVSAFKKDISKQI